MEQKIKWSQYCPEGLLRGGHAEERQLVEWLHRSGSDARECLEMENKDHAVYGRVVIDDKGKVLEYIYYCDTYMTDEELDEFIKANPSSLFYVAHKLPKGETI